MYDLEDEFTQRLLGNVIPIYYNIKETKVKVFEKNVEEYQPYRIVYSKVKVLLTTVKRIRREKLDSYSVLRKQWQ